MEAMQRFLRLFGAISLELAEVAMFRKLFRRIQNFVEQI